MDTTNRFRWRALAPPLLVPGVLVLWLITPSVSLAHERRIIGSGKYEVVVGWDIEPPYVNQRNAAGIRISKAGSNPAQPITGADKTLSVQIRQGAQTRLFELRAVFGQPGYYVADILPTRAGDYVWTFSGAIGADQVSETFDSADGKFDAVIASSAVEFPLSAPDPAQVTAKLQAAESAAQRAQGTAYVGIATGILGCLLALLARLGRPRSRPGVLSSRDAAVRRVPGAGL